MGDITFLKSKSSSVCFKTKHEFIVVCANKCVLFCFHLNFCRNRKFSWKWIEYYYTCIYFILSLPEHITHMVRWFGCPLVRYCVSSTFCFAEMFLAWSFTKLYKKIYSVQNLACLGMASNNIMNDSILKTKSLDIKFMVSTKIVQIIVQIMARVNSLLILLLVAFYI